MHNSPHWSIRTSRMLQRVFIDKQMLLYTPMNPFYELLNLSLAHESDKLKEEFVNEVASAFNPQTCDFLDPYYIFMLDLDEIPDQPIAMSGIIGIDNIAIEQCDNIDEFYSKRITRVEYDTGISITSSDTGIGIVYAHNKDDRYGDYYITFDKNPGEDGSLKKYNHNFTLEETTNISKMDRFYTDYYHFDADIISMDTGVNGIQTGGVYAIPYTLVDTGSFELYDFAHLDHSGYPMLIDSSEYSISGNSIIFTPCSGGRSTYNSTYYDSPIETGQPDQYWGGIYGSKMYYTPFTSVNNGLTTTSYFHNIPSLEAGFVYPNVPDATYLTLPYEEAETESSDDYLFRVAPKFVRPGSTVRVTAEYTKLATTTWADTSIDFSYTISDSDFTATNVEAVHIMIQDVKIQGTVTVTSNTISITALDSAVTSLHSDSTITVNIYYSATNVSNVTAIASYTATSTNYEQDYQLNEFGQIVPFSIVPVNITGITETYATPTITLETEYDLKGITYDPYRRVLWSVENNNKYLCARNPSDLSLVMNFSLFNNLVRDKIKIGESYYELVDYTPQHTYSFVSLKWYAGYLYLLTSNSFLYTIDLFKDIQQLDIEYDDGDIVYPEIDLLYTANAVDFAIDREGYINVLSSDNTIDRYSTHYDYAILDVLRDTLYFREQYDTITNFNQTPIGRNRITDLDRAALSYFNLYRHTGETLVEFYDRLYIAMNNLYNESVGSNSTRQGVLNALATEYNQTPYNLQQKKFIYLDYDPIETDPYTGAQLAIRLYVDNMELNRMAVHPSCEYDTGLSYYGFNSSYKYTSIFNDLADTGFIVWRDYDGDLSNCVEINYPIPYSGVVITYSHIGDDSQVYPYHQSGSIYYSKDTGTMSYNILPIDESFIYDSGVMTSDVIEPIEYMYSDIERQWGYFTLDKTPMSQKEYAQRQNILCYNIINSGILTGG